ncbi:hypothetical protein BC832DRAFT_594408 [Gaertneriomyces semiglobifer]|nr:hypothetical protein BC832DRAFT_594408 [Gaertneriomyces semiglobifer]
MTVAQNQGRDSDYDLNGTTTRLTFPSLTSNRHPSIPSRAKSPRTKTDAYRRAEAIVALLERKREQFHREWEEEVMERSRRSRKRREELVDRPRKVANENRGGQPQRKSPTRPPTHPRVYNNPIPPSWTSPSWYKEIVAQMHRRHPHFQKHHQYQQQHYGRHGIYTADTVDYSVASTDVLFGALLTSGATRFHDSDDEDIESHTLDVRAPRRIAPTPRPGWTSVRERDVKVKRRKKVKPKKVDVGECSLVTSLNAALKLSLPIPDMPSLERRMLTGEEAREKWDEAGGEEMVDGQPRRPLQQVVPPKVDENKKLVENEKKTKSKKQKEIRQDEIHRMTEHLYRNKQTAHTLLALHSHTLHSSFDTPIPATDSDEEFFIDATGVSVNREGEQYIVKEISKGGQWDMDAGYEIFVKREEPALEAVVEEEVFRRVVSASRRGVVMADGMVRSAGRRRQIGMVRDAAAAPASAAPAHIPTSAFARSATVTTNTISKASANEVRPSPPESRPSPITRPTTEFIPVTATDTDPLPSQITSPSFASSRLSTSSTRSKHSTVALTSPRTSASARESISRLTEERHQEPLNLRSLIESEGLRTVMPVKGGRSHWVVT